ncbi:carbohydrate esterase family 8 protein [Cercospora zeae-maydis SCOH1-5]|uniref:Pectinesterase n=1 Tax=Cercospora zeae-maydis SCOH1-5 TaxID=717836 RepID=A0A6A6F8A0_9PEZI|nr:carbohydrate esterase family 8 protein [Cercospora zeae-maydis SCOH1-5]
MKPFALLSGLITVATCLTTPPPGALVVSKTPRSGQYATVQQAVNALSTTSKTQQIIFIQPGTYNEQVYIQPLSGPLTVYGYSSSDLSYSANQVTITAGQSQQTQPSNDLSATLRVHTSNFKLYNVNVANSFGQGSQAVAVSANNGGQGYYGVKLTGFQDTLLAETGAQLYANSYIGGATDFIFGQTGQVWFEQCDLRVLAASLGFITASGRTSPDNGYYVINNSTVAAAPGNNVPAGAYYLGRPWGSFARVIFQRTSMTNVINPAGWTIWNTGDPRTGSVTFGEYANTGPGSQGARASFSQKLSSPISIDMVLGGGYASAPWVDTNYL